MSAKRGTDRSEKIEFDIFVRFSSATRARVKISDGVFQPSLGVACETRISYLAVPRSPRSSTLSSSRVKGGGWLGVRGEPGRKCGEREECEMAAAAKISPSRRKLLAEASQAVRD